MSHAAGSNPEARCLMMMTTMMPSAVLSLWTMFNVVGFPAHLDIQESYLGSFDHHPTQHGLLFCAHEDGSLGEVNL